MTIFEQIGDGGTAGNAVSTANSGGAVSTAFGTVVNTAGTFTWDNTHPLAGALPMKSVPSGSGASYGTWTINAASNWRYRGYHYLESAPDSELGIAWFGVGGTRVAYLSLLGTTGRLMIRNAAFSPVGTGPTEDFPLNRWVMVEARGAVGTSAAVEMRFYDTDHTTVLSSRSGTSDFGSSTFTALRVPFRVSTSTYTATHYAAGIKFADSGTDWLGPLSTTYNINLSDGVGVTDTGSPQQLETEFLQEDSVGVTETITVGLSRPRTQDDSVGVGDSLSVALTRAVNLSDGVGIADATSPAKTMPVTLSDSVGASDSTTGNLQGVSSSTLSDSVGVADSLTVARIFNISLSEGVGVSDAAGPGQVRNVTLSDGIGVTDSAVASASSAEPPSESNDLRRSMSPLRIARLVRTLVNKIRWGTGSPAGAVTAPVGTVYLRTDGAANTTLYLKTTGTGNTGWTAVSSA